MLLNLKIKNLRIQQNWSQENLGKETGMSQSEICKIEKAKIPLHHYQLIKFAIAFKIDLEELSILLPAYNKKFGSVIINNAVALLKIQPNNSSLVPQNDEAALLDRYKILFNNEPDETKRFNLLGQVIDDLTRFRERMKNYRDLIMIITFLFYFFSVDSQYE